jgi:serine/threonine-protein kinase
MIGRAEDCDIQIPSDIVHLQVSRHHCLLEIHPPTVRVRDLGSTNGTFVNGEKIGPRYDESNGSVLEDRLPFSKELRQGDHICLGQSALHLQVEVHAE